MAQLDGEKIKKLKRGEAAGYFYAVGCALAIAYFIVGFTVSEAYDIYGLKLSALICAPIIAVISAGGSAYCNIKFGGQLEREVKKYLKQTFMENAELLHPEKNSLNFAISVSDDGAEVKVNNYKEKIVFDFSPFGKLSAIRKSSIFSHIVNVLASTYFRLYDWGTEFKEISYTADNKKNGRVNFIIKDGRPDKKAYKAYHKIR